jgi:hypothetical protein
MTRWDDEREREARDAGPLVALRQRRGRGVMCPALNGGRLYLPQIHIL